MKGNTEMMCQTCKNQITLNGRTYELTDNLFAPVNGKLSLYQVHAFYFCGLTCLHGYIIQKELLEHDISLKSDKGYVQESEA